MLSGNRNFEGRIHADVRMNYLASPPLVVAFALTGTVDIDLATQPLGTGSDGSPVFLADVWPPSTEVAATVREALGSEMFRERYASVFEGDEHWQQISVAGGRTFAWQDGSTYVLAPPFFDGMSLGPDPVSDVHGARVLAVLGDSVTTDHISPAGSIGPDTPAGRYLTEHGVARGDFNSYGTRRGNHEVMMRGTFANIRLRNRLAPGTEGGITATPARRGADDDLRRRDAATPRRAPRSSCWPARSTAPGPAGTGRPRGRCSSGCVPCWRRASSASTAPTWSAWASCPCNSRPASRSSRWG